jgi:peptide/nickel transport system ATP-binding protein
MIAMAVINDPQVIIADEPTTALDVTVQAQILDILRALRDELSASIILITHDLGVVAGIADRIQVMYAGTVVETGDVRTVFASPRMPYTVGLLSSIPRPENLGERLAPIKGSPPSLVNMPPGCPFTPRCPLAQADCEVTEPSLKAVGAGGAHRVRCLHWDQIAALPDPRVLFTAAPVDTVLEDPVGSAVVETEEMLADVE